MSAIQAVAKGEGALPSLSCLARALLGRDLTLQSGGCSAAAGLPSRPVLTPTHLCLPSDLAVPEGLDQRGLLRAAIAHAVAHLKFSTPSVPGAGLKPMSVALISALEDARVERLLLHEHPGMLDWFLKPLRLAVQPEGVGFGALMSRLDLALMDPAYRDDHPWIHKARLLFEEQAAHLDDRGGFRQIALNLVHDLGQTRVAFRPGQYQVSAPHRDDNTFLWQHEVSSADPPPEVELQVPQPRPGQARSMAPNCASKVHEPAMEEVVLGQHRYPEWDHRLSMLRQDWCTVIDKLPPWRHVPMQAPPLSAAPMALKQSLPLNGGRRLRRQPEGDELDLNAAVEFMVAHRSQRSVESRVFSRRASADTATSILVLLDLSESTHDQRGEGQPTFLDLEKEAALLLADAVQARGDRIAVHGFSSNTRAEVSYYRLVDFGVPLGPAARAVLSAAPARHSTRLGAALRHAAASLLEEANDLKAILVLTDGAPSDIDVHTPHHLVEDARHAVHEARAAGVQVHGLVVDQQADTCARRIFGWRNHHMVDHAMALPSRLCSLYLGLTVA